MRLKHPPHLATAGLNRISHWILLMENKYFEATQEKVPEYVCRDCGICMPWEHEYTHNCAMKAPKPFGRDYEIQLSLSRSQKKKLKSGRGEMIRPESNMDICGGCGLPITDISQSFEV